MAFAESAGPSAEAGAAAEVFLVSSLFEWTPTLPPSSGPLAVDEVDIVDVEDEADEDDATAAEAEAAGDESAAAAVSPEVDVGAS